MKKEVGNCHAGARPTTGRNTRPALGRGGGPIFMPRKMTRVTATTTTGEDENDPNNDNHGPDAGGPQNKGW